MERIKKDISIIIPVKNRASLIGETLDSILAQTYAAKEIILVDDASIDGLAEALEPYKEKIVLLSNIGTGPGAARNTGLKHATGNFIQFFDSDDVMSVDKLEEQVTLLINNPDKDIVLGPYVMAEKKNHTWTQLDLIMQYDLPKRPLNQMVAEGWCSITQACMFTRRIIDRAGPWREDLMTHEDIEYWYRLGKLSPMPLHENKSITIYRQHKKQITDALTTDLDKTGNGIRAFQIILGATKSDGISALTKMILKGHIANYKKFYNKRDAKFKLNVTDFIYSIVAKLAFKIGRIKTGTAWQPDHGVNTDKRIFEKYLSKLYKHS